MLPRFGAGENPGSRILHILELVQGFARDPEQDSIAIVRVGGEKCLVEGLTNGISECRSKMFLR